MARRKENLTMLVSEGSSTICLVTDDRVISYNKDNHFVFDVTPIKNYEQGVDMVLAEIRRGSAKASSYRIQIYKSLKLPKKK